MLTRLRHRPTVGRSRAPMVAREHTAAYRVGHADDAHHASTCAPPSAPGLTALWAADDPARSSPDALGGPDAAFDPGGLAAYGHGLATGSEPLPHARDAARAPFGLPVLDDVPLLASLLHDLRQVDRVLSRAVDTLLSLEDTGHTEAVTGVGLDTWLRLVGRRTGADARMLRTTAAVFRRSPSLRAAFGAGAVSWAQTRSLVLAVHRLPGHLDDAIDAAIAEGIRGGAGAEPDDVTRVIRWTLGSLDPTPVADEQRAAEAAEFLSLQPRLDGSGGSVHGELGPVAFALLDAALSRYPGHAGAHVPDGTDSASNRDGVPGRATFAPDRPTSPAAPPGGRLARARVARLMAILDTHLHGEPGDRRTGVRPTLLLRAELDTLLDRAQIPGHLLTHLLGGHVRVSSETARRLIDERGADLRTVVLDDSGAVVGVGRRQRLAPGWLREAILAIHDTCSEPGCAAPARTAHLDHATPWHPHHPGTPHGRTDVDELAPLCARANLAKERDGWRAQQRPDGSRRWTHDRSGLTTRTLPATWRPPPQRHEGPVDDAPAPRPRSHPGRARPD